MPTATIEELWHSLRIGPNAVHRRVDATHPLELYAEFEPPEHFGLVLFVRCAASRSTVASVPMGNGG